MLSNKHALTSAFCLQDFLNESHIPDFDLYTLVAGRHDIDEGSAVFKIEVVQVQEKYRLKAPNVRYEISLITV